jgi:protein phosphatase
MTTTAEKIVVTDVVASSCQGGRPRQEDRFYARTHISVGGDGGGGSGGGAASSSSSSSSSASVSFFGIWDGTVCPLASDYVHTRCCDHHLSAPSFKSVVDYLLTSPANDDEDDGEIGDLGEALRSVVVEAYASTDADLLAECRALRNHYSSTTSVTALIAGGLIAIGNLGDSPLFLVRRVPGGGVSGTQVTTDHKPDQPGERARIERSGGSVQYLHRHNYKPFIRGGDFDRRKATGESAMQLQYSRAFGGKDLKPYGLSAEPSVVVTPLDGLKGMILCSDGISDVASPDDAASIVAAAWAKGEDAAARLVSWGVSRRAAIGMDADNCTALVVSFGSSSAGGEEGEGASPSLLLRSADFPGNSTQ